MNEEEIKINIIVLNYNGFIDTSECILSLLELEYSNFKVILIDNCSKLNEYNKLKEWVINQKLIAEQNILYFNNEQNIVGNINFESQFTIIRNYENLGFANGNNVGIEYAKQQGADFVYLLNNDTEVEPDSLSKLVNFMHSNDYAAITPQIRLFDPPDKIWNCGGNYSWPGNVSFHYGNADIKDVPQEGHKDISFITGCALLYDYKKIGPLSTKFFFGEEDNELSFRIRRMKLKMACVYDSIIYHKVSRSIKKSANATANRAQILYLNRFINFKDQYSFINYWVCILINTTYGIPMLMIRHKIGLLKSIKIFYTCIKDATNLDRVSKSKFESILNQK